MSSPHVDLAAAATAFRRDGACVVRGLLSPEEVARLAAGVEENLATPSERALEGGGDGESGRFFEDFRNWQRISAYEDVIRGSRLGEAAARLMRSGTARLHHDHLLVKEPGTTIRTPWHQDQPFYNIDGDDTVSFWIPLDPVPRESTLEFVAGSHAARTWYMPRSFFDGRPLIFDEGALEEVPDVEADRGAHRIVGWELEPGDAVAFNMLTLHAAAGSRNRRRAFSVRLVGDDVRLATRPHATSPTFPELDGVLGHGDMLDHPVFPVLWPREDATS
jgi:ectoine hydroxylase-related dioxygenase (phytanoyl-CoA dioxygenase family)